MLWPDSVSIQINSTDFPPLDYGYDYDDVDDAYVHPTVPAEGPESTGALNSGDEISHGQATPYQEDMLGVEYDFRDLQKHIGAQVAQSIELMSIFYSWRCVPRDLARANSFF